MSRCVGSIYDAALDPAQWEGAVLEIGHALGRGAGATIVHAPHICFAEGEFWTHDVDHASYRDAPPELLSPVQNRGIALALAERGRLVDRRRFIRDADMPTDPVSRQFFLPNDIWWMLIGITQMDDEVGSLFALSRPRGAPDFDEAETILAQDLATHVGRAMAIHRRLRLLELKERTFGAALERLACAVVLADGDLRVQHANAAAEALFISGPGANVRLGKLQLADRRAQDELERAARALAGRAPRFGEARLRSRRPEPLRPFQVVVYPAIGGAPASLAPRGRILVFLKEGETQEISPERLVKHFSLTRAEVRVAALALRALRVAEIAAALSLSEATVKTHLRMSYLKVGARSRAQFMNLVRAEA